MGGHRPPQVKENDMSNRRKATQERVAQMYRNAGRSEPAIHADAAGNIRRGQGRNNFPYGPGPTHVHPSVLTLHRHATRPRRAYGITPDFESMNRDELRVAAKERGVEGWHKMNKAQLLAAVTA